MSIVQPLRLTFVLFLHDIILCHRLHHRQWLVSFFSVKLSLHCKWRTKMRSCFFPCKDAGTGTIILAQVWVSSFQESFRLTVTQISSFENFGPDYQHKEWKLSLSPPSASQSSLFLPDRIARTQSTQCFPLNKPHVSSQKIQCVISGGRREVQGKKEKKKRGKVKCTQRYWRVTQREEREVESCRMVRHD